MKYLLASLLITAALTSQAQAAPSANENAEMHQVTKQDGIEWPRYMMLTKEQKNRYLDKNVAKGEDAQVLAFLDTYQDLFRVSPIVFRGRLSLDQADKDKASVSVQRIYKGDEVNIPKLVEIDDSECLDRYIMGSNFIIFLGRSELAPATPDFCDLEIQEVYHPAMQYLDQWEKGSRESTYGKGFGFKDGVVFKPTNN